MDEARSDGVGEPDRPVVFRCSMAFPAWVPEEVREKIVNEARENVREALSMAIVDVWNGELSPKVEVCKEG